MWGKLLGKLIDFTIVIFSVETLKKKESGYESAKIFGYATSKQS